MVVSNISDDMSESQVENVHMSKVKPETFEKNSSTVRHPAGIELSYAFAMKKQIQISKHEASARKIYTVKNVWKLEEEFT